MHFVSTVWLIWYAAWVAAAVWRTRAVKTVGLAREMPSRLLVIAGVILLFFYRPYRMGGEGALWQPSLLTARLLFLLLAAGLLFPWWARVHLGSLWSANITRKPDHRVVDTGPYGLVRHPIYSGLMLAAFSTAALEGTLAAIAGALLLTLGFYLKARLEEQFLRRELGAEYDAYSRRVPMLVPFGRRT